MRKYNISEAEFIGAFNSPNIKKGYKTGSTLGVLLNITVKWSVQRTSAMIMTGMNG